MTPSSRFGSRAETIVLALAGLAGTLRVPEHAAAVVVFAHGSSSSRHSLRNREIAETLHHAGFATLLCDLLAEAEADERQATFDVGLVAHRLEAAVHCVTSHPATAGLAVGLFGASTGAAAVLVAAAERPASVRAVVSCGGRPDLAGEAHLRNVVAPTLLIVGSADFQALNLNRWARSLMICPNDLATVPGAAHLFEDPGAMKEVATLAADWFRRWLARQADPASI